MIERLAIQFPHGAVDSKDLPAKHRSEDPVDALASAALDAAPQSAALDVDQLLSAGIDMKKYLSSIEISLIVQALSKTNNVVARAATLLNMRRTTLVEKMRKYEIDRVD